MVTITDKILEEISSRLVEAIQPERIYLFGSRAQGLTRKGSDLDLLVVVRDGAGREKELVVRARRAIGPLDCGVDILVYTAGEFDRRSGWRSNFEHTVRNTGRLLYGEDGMAYAREWLAKAWNDLRSAEALLSLSPPATDTAAFHCQQAVEKALKAFLTHRNEPFEKLHDLTALCRLCAGFDEAFGTLEDDMATLTRYAVQFRYPGEKEPTAEEVRAALGVVQEVWNFVLSRLPDELREFGRGKV